MLSERLKALRMAKKYSQQYIANHLGITRQAYAKYEKNDSQPDTNSLAKLANLYDVTTDYLIGISKREEFSEVERIFLSDIDKLSLEELKDKHILTIDGKPATDEEIDVILSIIRSLRKK